MPHLAIETYVSQYFWFMLILVLFHTFMTNEVIPRISSLLKARKVREGSSISSGEGSEDSSAVALANNALALTANYSTPIVENSVKKSSISTWVNKA